LIDITMLPMMVFSNLNPSPSVCLL